LVIAGAWNPDILTPQWVASQAMGLQLDQNFPVNVQLAISNPQQRPRFEFEGIEFTAARGAVTFFFDPNDAERVQKTVSTATKILALLSHTPVSGFGFNFNFEVEDPHPGLLQTFAFADLAPSFLEDPDATAATRKWTSAISSQGCLITITVELQGSNKIVINSNSHFEVKTASEASAALGATGLVDKVKNDIRTIVERLSQLGGDA